MNRSTQLARQLCSDLSRAPDRKVPEVTHFFQQMAVSSCVSAFLEGGCEMRLAVCLRFGCFGCFGCLVGVWVGRGRWVGVGWDVVAIGCF